MNRREFNTFLGAAIAAPTMPLPTAAASAQVTLPPATYLWADLIARARGTVDAGFLARRLNLSAEAAQHVMGQLVQNGAVHAPGIGGLAKAVKPIDYLPNGSAVTVKSTVEASRSLRDPIETLLEDAPSDMEEPSASGLPDQA